MDLREFNPDPARELQREKAELRLILLEIRDAKQKLYNRGFEGEQAAYRRIEEINLKLGVEA